MSLQRLSGRAPAGIRGFAVERRYDATGVSGTGIVLEGVLLSTGLVIVHWLTPPPKGSIGVFDSWDLLMETHILPHPENETVVYWWDGEVWFPDVFEKYPPRPWPAPPGAGHGPPKKTEEPTLDDTLRARIEALEAALAAAKMGRHSHGTPN